jgi:hypothetical protein
MNPAINGPKTGPLNGQKAIKAIGGPTSELMNMSLTVPPEMERKAEPANPVMNLKIRWTAVSSSDYPGCSVSKIILVRRFADPNLETHRYCSPKPPVY